MKKAFSTKSVVAAIVLGTFVFVAPGRSQTVDVKELTWAQKFFDEKNFNAAEDLVQEFLKTNDNNKSRLKTEFAKAYYLLAKIAFATQDEIRCEASLKSLFEIDANYPIPETEDSAFKTKAAIVKNSAVGMITIYLKDGGVLRGKLISSDAESISFESATGIDTVKKGFIQKTDPPLPLEANAVAETPARPPAPISPSPAPPSRVRASGGRLAFALGGLFGMGMKAGQSVFSRTPSYSFMEAIRDDGTLEAQTKTGLFGGHADVVYSISDKIGVQLAADYFSTSAVDLVSKYTFEWKFFSYSKYTDSTSWTSNGNFSAIPISLNLLYRLRLAEKTRLNIHVGGSVFLTSISLTAQTGYGTAQQSGGWNYVDWFLLDLEIAAKEIVVGANGGLEFEHSLSGPLSLCVDLKYFFAPVKSHLWKLIPATSYQGDFGNLTRTISADQSNLPALPQIKTDLNFSRLAIILGLRYGLGSR